MSEADKQTNDEHINTMTFLNDVINTAKKKGYAEGFAEGIEKGRAEERAKFLKEKDDMMKRMLDARVDMGTVINVMNFTQAEISMF